jgi:hypothetical protein
MLETSSIRFLGSDFSEISRTIEKSHSIVQKSLHYSTVSNANIRDAALPVIDLWNKTHTKSHVECQQNFEILKNQIIIHQMRVRHVPTIKYDTSHFLDLFDYIEEKNSKGWVFGDLCKKNILFTGNEFKVIDFEPFLSVIRNKRRELRTTAPFLHPNDKKMGMISALSDRLALLSFLLATQKLENSSTKVFFAEQDKILEWCSMPYEKLRPLIPHLSDLVDS